MNAPTPVILITGAAGALGRAVAQRFAAEGAVVEVVAGPDGEEALSDPHAMDLLLLGLEVEEGA